MFVCVARVSLDIPAAGSLKAKRQVLRKVIDRVKAKFNVSAAEVEGHDLWQRAVVALALVGNEKPFVNEQMDKVLHFIEEMYVAPVSGRELEILSFGDQLFTQGATGESFMELPFQRGERSLAEAEGMGAWEERHTRPTAPSPPRTPANTTGNGSNGSNGNNTNNGGGKLSLEEARARAKALRNKREWER